MKIRAWLQDDKTQARIFFLILTLIEIFVAVALILERRISRGNDTLEYFMLQYYFLNNAVTAGEIPQWIPFLTHGAIATWSSAAQAGLLQNVLLLIAPVARFFPFLTLFHVGLFLDKCLLLTGVWLLARRFFRSVWTLVFITSAVTGTCLWADSPWLDFHFYFAIPWILHLMHLFLETRQWRYAAAAGNLLALQLLSNLIYIAPMSSLVVFVYFAFYFLCSSTGRTEFKSIRWGWRTAAAILFVILCVACAYGTLQLGTDAIAIAAEGRRADGSVPLDIFLHYGGYTGFSKWLELCMRFSLADFSLYSGLLILPLALLGLAAGTRERTLHFFPLFLAFFFFSSGFVVAHAFYYGWPMMKYYRHIAHVVYFGKIFLCFAAGIGFEALWLWRVRAAAGEVPIRSLTAGCWLAGFFLIAVAVSLWMIAGSPERITWLFGQLASYELLNDAARVAVRLREAALLAGLMGGMLLLFLMPKLKNYGWVLAGGLLALHAADVYGYGLSELQVRTRTLTEEQADLSRFQQVPYAVRRELFFWKDNPRAFLLFPEFAQTIKTRMAEYQAAVNDNERSFRMHRLMGHSLSGYGAEFWYYNVFCFRDQLGTSFRTDSWMQPFDQFTRACWGQALDSKESLHAMSYGSYMRPVPLPGCQRIAGLTADKIQIFTEAYAIPEAGRMAALIGNPAYRGDALAIAAEPDPANALVRWIGTEPLDQNRRLEVTSKILRYDANHLELEVNLKDHPMAWLVYSDVWHPSWHAAINGQAVPVYQANLTYKAVLIRTGLNRVHFFFRSRVMSFLHVWAGLNSFVWLGMVLLAVGGILRGRDSPFFLRFLPNSPP